MSTRPIGFDIFAKDNASRVFDKIGDSADRTESKLGKLGSGMKKFGAVAAAGIAVAGTAAVAGGKYFFDLGARLEQMEAKANTVFGNQIGMVDKWASKTAHAMGLTSREATGLAANFGDLLIPMGFTRKQAAGMSTDVVGLSGALSQWSGGTKSAADVSEILAAAMLGETDGLKSLGIAISAADIEARLLTTGQDKLTGAARQQAEAQAIQALIFEKSTDAQAAFAAGGSPLLSAQSKLKAIFGEVRDDLAVKLVPMFVKTADFLVVKLGPALGKAGKWAKEHLLPPLKAVGAFIKDKVMPAAKEFGEKVLNGLRGFIDNVSDSLKDNKPFLTAIWEGMKKLGDFVFTKVIPAIGKLAEKVLPILGDAIGKGIKILKVLTIGFTYLGEYGIKAFRFLLTAAMETFNGILIAAEKGLGWIPGLGDKIRGAQDKFEAFKDKTINALKATEDALVDVRNAITRIPKTKTVHVNVVTTATGVQLPTSGTVPGKNNVRARGGPVRKGSPYLVGEEGPELFTPEGSGAIIPAAQTARRLAAANASGGGNVYITISGALDPVAVGRQVEQALAKVKRLNGGRELAFQ